MRFPFNLVKLVLVSWIFWGILTSTGVWFKFGFKQGVSAKSGGNFKPLSSLNSDKVNQSGLVDADVLVLTAHPDDEAMFFTPTLLELAKQEYNNKLHLFCLSNGDADGIGTTREKELRRVANMLGFESVEIGAFVDNINAFWDDGSIQMEIDSHLKTIKSNRKNQVILTFDEDGVSGHPNHVSLNKAVKNYTKSHPKVKAWGIRSWPIVVKYSSFLLSNIEMILELIGPGFINEKLQMIGFSVPVPVGSSGAVGSAGSVGSESIIIHSNINGWFLSMATMTYGHYSQMVAFRWGWVILSKYMNSNELVRI